MSLVLLGTSVWVPAEGLGPEEQSGAHVIAIVGTELEIYDAPGGKKIGCVYDASVGKKVSCTPNTEIELPVPVIQVGQAEWLKIRLDGRREVWIKARAVRTRKPLGGPRLPAAASATRG
jgi:hypothetical protein